MSISSHYVDQEVFRQVVGHFASGVTVITTAEGDQYYGTTASAVSSLSMEPPMMLMCLNQNSTTHDAVQRTGYFAINILAEDQQLLAGIFGRKGDTKFDDVSYTVSAHGGVPLIEGALATIVCAVQDAPVGGTHSVFFGAVLEANASVGQPLAYYRGKFSRLGALQELESYTKVRDWVLLRHTRLYQTIDAVQVKDALGLSSNEVHVALIRLNAEGLVIRTGENQYTPRPITVEFSSNLYDAREVIEKGVVASKIADLDDKLLELLTGITERMEAIRTDPSGTVEEFLSLHSVFHRELVGASRSADLVDAYRKLSLAVHWRGAWLENGWREELDHRQLVHLVEALKAQDLHQALDAVSAYIHQAKHFAQLALERQGGEV